MTSSDPEFETLLWIVGNLILQIDRRPVGSAEEFSQMIDEISDDKDFYCWCVWMKRNVMWYCNGDSISASKPWLHGNSM